MKVAPFILLILLFGNLGCTRPEDTSAKKVIVEKLQQTEVQAGNGKELNEGEMAILDYTVMTARGQILKSTLAEGKPVSVSVGTNTPSDYPVGKYLKGMRVGGRRRVTFPLEKST